MLMMVGRLITASRMAPLRALSPLGRWNTRAIQGPMTTIPRKPSTTEGIPAKISMTGFRVSGPS